MSKTNLVIIILSFDLQLQKRCIVSKDAQKYLELTLEITSDFSSIEQALEKLFQSHVKLGFGWVKPMLFDVIKQEDNVNIYYTCSIPPETELIDTYYISSNVAIINKEVRKAMLYA
jgi:hypothetical protein